MTIFKGIKKIQEHFGKEAQTKKCIEELAELIQALSKGNLDNIVEETADVLIMVNQVISLYGIEEEVEKTIDDKVNRTLGLIEIYKKHKREGE